MPVRNRLLSKGSSRSAGSVSHAFPADWLNAVPTGRHAIIVGAGPNGKPLHGREPDGLKIALNCAITIPWRWDIWMVFDEMARHQPWFKTNTSAHRVFGANIARYVPHDLSFEYMPTMHSTTELQWGILHGGASVAGCAIQLAYWLKCERATLIGIDQWGDKHFDGTSGAPKHFGKQWSSMKLLEKVIRIVVANGMTVDSASKTQLSVPIINLW